MKTKMMTMVKKVTATILAVATMLTEETYDIVDINRMAEGDVIYINKQIIYTINRS